MHCFPRKSELFEIFSQRSQAGDERSKASALNPQALVGLLFREASTKGDLEFLLTLRSSKVRTHPSQVCLPGGGIEISDEGSITRTLDREFAEEVGLPEDKVFWFSKPWISMSSRFGVSVAAHLGFLNFERELHLSWPSEEVAEAAWLPLADLLNRKLWTERTLVGRRVENDPAFHAQSFPVWLGWHHATWGLTGAFLWSFCQALDSSLGSRYGFSQ